MLHSRVVYGLTHKRLARLERLARDKRSSLLRTLVNYGREKFCSISGDLVAVLLVLELVADLGQDVVVVVPQRGQTALSPSLLNVIFRRRHYRIGLHVRF